MCYLHQFLDPVQYCRIPLRTPCGRSSDHTASQEDCRMAHPCSIRLRSKSAKSDIQGLLNDQHHAQQYWQRVLVSPHLDSKATSLLTKLWYHTYHPRFSILPLHLAIPLPKPYAHVCDDRAPPGSASPPKYPLIIPFTYSKSKRHSYQQNFTYPIQVDVMPNHIPLHDNHYHCTQNSHNLQCLSMQTLITITQNAVHQPSSLEEESPPYFVFHFFRLGIATNRCGDISSSKVLFILRPKIFLFIPLFSASLVVAKFQVYMRS